MRMTTASHPAPGTVAVLTALTLLAGCRSTAAAHPALTRVSTSGAASAAATSNAATSNAATSSAASSNAPASRTPASTAGAGTTGAQTVSALVQQLDTCIHQHGAPNFPDPYVDAAGKVAFPDSAPDLPASAQSACQHIIDRLPNPGNAGPTAISGAEFQQWLQFAVCMRSHGLPAWPDPKSDGSFPLPASLRGSNTSGIAPAFEACRSLDPNPNGKWTVSQAGS